MLAPLFTWMHKLARRFWKINTYKPAAQAIAVATSMTTMLGTLGSECSGGQPKGGEGNRSGQPSKNDCFWFGRQQAGKLNA